MSSRHASRGASGIVRTRPWRLVAAAGVVALGMALSQLVAAAEVDGSDVAAKLGGFNSVVGQLSGAVSNATSNGDEYADEANASSVPFFGGTPGRLLQNAFAELGPLGGFTNFAPGDTEKVKVIDDKVNAVDAALQGGVANFPKRVYMCGAAVCDLAEDEIQELTSVDIRFQLDGGPPDGTVDFDSLGLPSVGFALPSGDGTKLKVHLEWKLTARLIADETGSLRLAPSDDPARPHELTLGASLSLDKTSFVVNLGALKVDATEKRAPTFSGTLEVDVADNGDMSFGFAPGAGFTARWQLATTADSPLKGVSGLLDIAWPLGGPGVPAGGLKIIVDDIKIDTQDLVGTDLQEAAGWIRDVTHPIRSVTSPLFEPIPGLSDLSASLGGADVTMLRLMEETDQVDDKLRSSLEKLQRLDDAAAALKGGEPLELGSFTLIGDDALKPMSEALRAGALGELESLYEACGPCKESVDAFRAAVFGDAAPGEDDFEVRLPVVEEPESLAGLLLGRDVELITFRTGERGYKDDVNIPLARFLIFSVDIGGEIQATFNIKGGVDTRGITDALVAGTAADVVNGVYIQNPTGGDGAVVRLSSDVELDLATGIEFLEVELGGGPKVDVLLKVPSTAKDGKLRPALAKDGIGCELLAADDAKSDFYVNVTATFDYLIDDYTESLAEHTFLTENDLCAEEDESIDVAVDDLNGNLVITTASQRKVPASEPDTVTVYMTHHTDGAPAKIVVTVNNNRDEEFDAAGIENVRYDSSDDLRPVIFRVVKNDDEPFERNVYVETGGGDDDVAIDSDGVVQVRTNDGADKIIITSPVADGSGDEETLTLVNAGPGDDYISGSDERDVIGGDLGNDVIYGGGGDDQLNGGPGNDTILDTSPEGNCLIGGAGNDQIIAGPGDDQLFGDDVPFFTCTTNVDPEEPGVDSDGTDVLITGGGADFVVAGGKADEVRLSPTNDFRAIADRGATAWKQGVTVHGNGGNDVITTGNGPDWIHGGPDDDKIYADRGPIDPTVLRNGDRDTIFGGLGADRIESDVDDDEVYGDNGIDTCALPIIGQPDERDTDGGADDVFGGDGDDRIALEGGDDKANGEKGDDVICGHGGTDTIHGGDHDDIVLGGTGGDTIDGDAGEDAVFGNADADTIDGGTDDDRLVGGSSAAGTDDAADTIHGSDGADVIIGDNGVVTGTTTPIPSVFDLFAGDSTFGGSDTINGGAGMDRVFGGLHGDTIHGDGDDDHLEGNLGDDAIYGDAGEDDLIGGTSSEALPGAVAGKTAADASDVGETLISGGTGRDVIIGDNGIITRPGGTDPIVGGVARSVTLLDRERTGAALAAVSGGDYIEGNQDSDRIYGQGGADYIKGNEADDFVEGNQDGDRLEGNDGEDDLIGGSSFTSAPGVGDPDGSDRIAGGAGADVILGDNAAITRAATGSGSGSDWDTVANNWLGPVARRSITLLDKATVTAGNFGGDELSGGAGEDVLFGQDGDDTLFGGSHDDYQEGNGGSDTLFGDQVAPPTGDARESGQLELDGATGPDGQDDQMGGSSWAKATNRGAITGQRDGNDELHGDGNADVQLGDNGRILRVIAGGAYATHAATTGKATIIRQSAGPSSPPTALPGRFDVGTHASSGVWGNDILHGDDGDDLQLGQDGDDTLYGGADDDDMYGELGNDRMFGEGGEDAMIGDRGLITNRLMTGPGSTFSVTSPLSLSFTPFAAHPLDRRVDLNDDGDGAPLQAPGLTTGGNDFMRGGPDHDALHGAAGDDLMNGDGGGDYLFGGDGVDAMWGGRGRECADQADAACLNDRGVNDSYVDYLFGGRGRKSDPVTGGADILDYRPRPGLDPAAWFEITGTRPTDSIADHQHHQGIDWIYGGWDRDVMQADVADNGPNAGDRLMDWTGAYNLYTHCPSAYGGYNDIRLLNPSLLTFLERLAFSLGAGSSLADVQTKGSSGFNELALVYQSDVKANSGSAYPGTPGHFDEFSCEP